MRDIVKGVSKRGSSLPKYGGVREMVGLYFSRVG